MATREKRVVLPGSKKAKLAGAKISGKLDPETRLEVTVRVRARQAPGAAQLAAATGDTVTRREHLSREDFAARFGASPEDLDRVEDFAHEHELDVVGRHGGQRTVRLSGTVRAMEAAFGVKLQSALHGKTRFRHRSGSIRTTTRSARRRPCSASPSAAPPAITAPPTRPAPPTAPTPIS